MKCCGTNCMTSYCPTCGRKMLDYCALSGLLAHCEKMANQWRKNSERKKEYALSCGDDQKGRYYQKRAGKSAIVSKKWADWLQELSSLMEFKASHSKEQPTDDATPMRRP